MAEVTLTNAQVLQSVGALNELVATVAKLPVKVGYAAVKNLKKLQAESETLEELRKQFLEEHAEKTEDGQLVTEKDKDGNPTQRISFKSEDDKKSFVEKLNEVYSQEVSLPLHLVSLNSADDLELSGQLLFALEWMFTE